jgi:glutathione S-transferase
MNQIQETQQLTLHDWRISAYSKKVRMGLRFKGVRVRREAVPLTGMGRIKAKTGVAKVPVLVDGDRWVNDSTRILEYLERRWPEPSIYPRGEKDRLRARLIEDWADEALNRTVEPTLWLNPRHLDAMLPKLREDLPGIITALALTIGRRKMLSPFRAMVRLHGSMKVMQELLVYHLDLIEEMLGDDPYIFGPTPTVADFAIGAQLDNLHELGEPAVLERSRLCRLVESCRGLLDDAGDPVEVRRAAVA